MRIRCFAALVLGMVFVTGSVSRADELASALAKLSPNVLKESESLREMLPRDIYGRIRAANQQSTADWRKIQSRADWEAFRDERIARLRKSLGDITPQPQEVTINVTSKIEEDGYLIQNVTYESRPGVTVTANLYVPTPPREKMPGILLSHSHHSPKSQGELQTMGGLWARAGCYVLVPDHVGHGERRQHPFATAADYPEKFQVGRQDYHFRYNTAMQLYVAGESLMGWMVRDLRRGVDVLLAQEGIDAERIALLGGVAGGGDPAAVTAALDERIKVLVPFNFGGPQPETRYPLPDDAEEKFDYAGGGSWESTRNLHRSAVDGFLPWVIVASVAPRAVIHAHEFSWDQERDPVWKRYQKVFGFYDARDRLGFAHGFGTLKQQEPDASHCGNIGRPHRERIHKHLKDWWGIEVDEDKPVKRHTAEELTCLPTAGKALRGNRTLRRVALMIADEVVQAREEPLRNKPAAARLTATRATWQSLLGDVAPYAISKTEGRGDDKMEGVRVQRFLLHGEREIRLPVLLSKVGSKPGAVTLVLSQSGKNQILLKRAALLAKLLDQSTVCLVDLRGTGESMADEDRGRRSENTSLAASELMLGETLVGARLRDARSVLQWLRERNDYSHVAVLGESLAPVNSKDTNVKRPLELDQPTLAEPLGPTLALLIGLFEDKLPIIAARGGLGRYASLMEGPFVHVPFDVIVPSSAAQADVPLIAAALLPKQQMWISDFVDGRNQRVKQGLYSPGADGTDEDDEALAKWLSSRFKSHP
jgi:dienelactone hydrolase